jgi:hypothetical protein
MNACRFARCVLPDAAFHLGVILNSGPSIGSRLRGLARGAGRRGFKPGGPGILIVFRLASQVSHGGGFIRDRFLFRWGGGTGEILGRASFHIRWV